MYPSKPAKIINRIRFILLLTSILNSGLSFTSIQAGEIDIPGLRAEAKVKFAEGKLFIPYTDFYIPAPGFPLELTRTYNSQSKYYGPFGYGWTTNLSTGIYQISDIDNSLIKVISPRGLILEFYYQGEGLYITKEKEKITLTRNWDGTYTLTYLQGNKDILDREGVLIKKTDTNGNELILTYTDDKLYQVTDSVGRSLTFTSTGDYITGITDPAGRTYRYTYDSVYNLVKVTDPAGNATRYEYDNRHNLTRITYPTNAVVNITYNGEEKEKVKVTSITGPEGIERTYQYAYIVRIDPPPYVFGPELYVLRERLKARAPFRTLKTNSRGYTTRYLYTGDQQYLAETDPDNNERSTVRDERFSLLSEIDKNGYEWTYTYDDNGNMLSKTSPKGETWTYTYEPNKVITLTDPRGYV